MAVVYITEHTAPSVFQGGVLPVVQMPPLASQTVAIGAGSVQSSAFNAKTRIVGISADAVCSVEFGANPTATATSKRLPADTEIFYEVNPGDKVAVITNT